MNQTKRWLKQLTKFSAVGVINTIIDFLLFAFLTSMGVHYLPAQVISYGGGALNSFLLNRTWTFQKPNGKVSEQVLKFILVNGLAMGASGFCIFLFREQLHFGLPIAKVFSIGVSQIVNFTGYKFMVFRRHSFSRG